MPLIPVDSILVENRYRKHLGNLFPLMESIDALGLLHPIIVNSKSRLISGARRLEACKRLGWKTIPARVVDLDELRVEHDENVIRENFLPSEAVAIKRALEQVEQEKARRRMSQGGKLSKKGIIRCGESPHLMLSKTRDKLAAHVGMSSFTLRRAEEVVAAAEVEPEKYGDLLQEMDSRHGSVNGVYRKLKVRQEVERLQEAPPTLPTGKYSVIVADPPWRFDTRNEDTTKKNLLPYPSMSIEEIKSVPVQGLAEDDCILFLWCTNTHVHEAFHVVEAWGFQYKTVMTWFKTTNGDGVYLGVGNWLRNNTEQVLVAVKGRPIVNLTNQTTSFTSPAEKGNHSKKPDALYQTVESLCPQRNRLDMFARVKRDGWDAYGLIQTEIAAFGTTSLSTLRR